MRGRFFWRIGCLLGVFFFLAVSTTSALLWFFAGLTRGPVDRAPFGPGPFALVVLVVVAGALLAVRGLRRTVAPVADLIEAAGRVEAGDYTTRVTQRGPPEVRALARAFNEMSTRLEANERERRTLLAEVTHELRTPLTVVQGNLEALVDRVHPADEAHLAAILEETRVLSRLIDDLRTLALAERGALALYREPTDLQLLLAETTSSFSGQAEAAGVTLTAEAADELPLAEVDPVRVREVVANLITNALRYTRSGSIQVAAEESAGGDAIEVAVRDTGSGISPEALPRIFESFYKSAESRGTGLGLAVAKKIVDAHGGTITAQSTLGQGTTIRFSLPLAATSDGSHPSRSRSTER